MIGTCCSNLQLPGAGATPSPTSMQAHRQSLKATGKLPITEFNDAVGLHSLGCVRFDHGRYSGAANLLSHALIIYSRYLVASDAHLVPLLDKLGDCYFALKEYARAARFYRQALSIEELHYGAHSVQILERLRKLSHVCTHLGLQRESSLLKERINHIEGVDDTAHQQLTYGTGLLKLFRRTMRLEAVPA